MPKRHLEKLLMDDRPLQVLPKLAKLVGLNEALVLQQIHYWLIRMGHLHDGEYWIYNSYTEWHEQFPFWSISTIKRIVTKLEKQHLVKSDNFNVAKYDRTKWYTVDYDGLDKISNSSNEHSVKDSPSIVSECTEEETTMTPPIPETSSETTSDIESKEMGNSHKVPLEPQPETPQKPQAVYSSKNNNNIPQPEESPESPKERPQPYKFTTLSDYLAFPDVSFDEKCKNLIKNRATLKRPEMVGMLGDILIQNTVNAKDFLTATRGIKPVYPVIGRMLNEFPLEYLIYFFEGHRIPFKPEAPWTNYLWGAAKRQYAYWSADEEIARSEKVKQEEAESLGELAEMMKEIKEPGDDKWQ